MIRTLLIANRGEIACRVIRTARRMGIATVAVFSDADREALHVAMADRAVCIGPAPARESYLNDAAILDAARVSKADAVHPGYGFLSENAEFARSCVEAGLVFVGPSPAAIEAMGDKARARRLMTEAGVPVVPGYDGRDQSDERLEQEARRIGFPLLVKAVAGGGGRGMRRVDNAANFAEALAGARREAESAFSNKEVLLERMVEPARHIEVQVLGDGHGNILHLGERDCSTQRRHQKVIEEQPSPFVSEYLRKKLTEAAVEAAHAVNYIGAGTVEFVVGEDGSFHFLEMNTRLQVEHPVTEMVTGLDLVEWQLRVAQGEALPAQDEVRFTGHAIEARLYAEDPVSNFAPQTGRILRWRPDEALAIDGVRVDTGVREGDMVTPFYDPMVAKVVAHGGSRLEATARLEAALKAAPMLGLRNNAGLLNRVLRESTFRSGAMTTGMLDAEPEAAATPSDTGFAIAALALCLSHGGDWFRSTGIAAPVVTLVCRERVAKVAVSIERGEVVSIAVDGQPATIENAGVAAGMVNCWMSGELHAVPMAMEARAVWLFLDGQAQLFEEADPLSASAGSAASGTIRAPLAGVVSHVAVEAGQTVESGQVVLVIEAMKMETRLAAAGAGTVAALHVAAGRQVKAGDILAEIDLEIS